MAVNERNGIPERKRGWGLAPSLMLNPTLPREGRVRLALSKATKCGNDAHAIPSPVKKKIALPKF